MAEPFILCHNVVKVHKVDAIEVTALQGLDLTIQPGEVMAITGSSGSGKTTLLNVLGGLDRPTSGRVRVAGHDLLKLSDRALDVYRRRTVGFVWQQKARNLIPYLNIERNIALPMIMNSIGRSQRRAWTHELITSVGLEHRRGHTLAQLSGGEQQRVAIAVALANQPQLLLADEPTGELDSSSAETIFELFHTLNRAYGITVVIVTHDKQIARFVDRVVMMQDGKTASETLRRGDHAERTDDSLDTLLTLDGGGRFQLPRAVRERYGIANRMLLHETPEGVLLRAVEGDESDDEALEVVETANAERGLARVLRRALRRWE